MSDPKAEGTTDASLVLTLAWETLADLYRRSWVRPPDRLILALLGEPTLTSFIVAEPARNPLVALKRAPNGRLVSLPTAGVLPGRTIVSPHHYGVPRAILPRARVRRYGRSLATAVTATGAGNPVVVTTDPRVAAFAELGFARRVIYFARDDWAAHPEYRSIRTQLLSAYREMRERGTDVVGVSNVLVDRLAPTGRSMVLSNGLEPDEWLKPTDPPPWFTALSRPRLVYAGTIDSRIDIDWLKNIVEVYPGASIVLVGPTDRDPTAHRKLRAIPNVVLPGHIAQRSEVAGIIGASDVCLIPHVRSPLTEAMDPLKLYEYLAAGRPVVATDLKPLRERTNGVCLVSMADEAPAAVERALGMPRVPEDRRLTYIGENSWTARAQQLLSFAFLDEWPDQRQPHAHDWTSSPIVGTSP